MMAWNPGAFRMSPDAAVAEALVQEGLRTTDHADERAWLLLVQGACARLYRGSEPFGQGVLADPRPIAERIASAEQGLELGRRIGLDDLVAAAGQALGMLYGLDQRYGDVLSLARREVEHLVPDQSRLEHSDAVRKLAVHVINIAAEFEQGLQLGNRCRLLLQASGARNPHHRMHTLWPILAASFHLGRWVELLEPLQEHVEAFRAEPAVECQFVRDGPVIGASALFLLGRRDEAAEVAALLAHPLVAPDSASAWQARHATLTGDPATAVAIAADKALHGRTYGPQHAYALLEALLALGDLDAAEKALAAARLALPGNALLGPMIDRVEGVLRGQAGDQAAAAELLRRAAHGFAERRAPFEQARALRDLVGLADVPPATAVWAAMATAEVRATMVGLGMPISAFTAIAPEPGPPQRVPAT
jgi:tetratricopeptide (TPR) repeat protein